MTSEQAAAGRWQRRRPVAAVVVAVTAWLLAALAVLTLPWGALYEGGEALFFVVDVVVAVVYGLVARVLLARRAVAVAWWVALAAIGDGVAAFAAGYARVAPAGFALPGADAVASLTSVAWVPGTLGLIVVVPWLVREGALSAGAHAAVWTGAAACVAVTAARVLVPDGTAVVPVPAALEALAGSLTLQMGTVVVLGALATADAARRWSRGSPAARRGLGWLALGSGLMTLSFVPLALPLPLAMALVDPGVVPAIQLAAQAFFPAAILVVVLRQQLWGIDLVVSRTLVWGLLTAGSVVAYLLIVFVAGAVLPVGSGTGGVLAAAVLAGLAVPARAWLQRRVDLLVRGPAAAPGAGAEHVGRSLGSAAPAELVHRVLEAVVEALRGEGGEVRLPDGRQLAAAGGPGGPPLAVPLAAAGEHVGELAVWGAPGERLDARTERDLQPLAGVVAAVVRLAMLTAELEAARARTVAARAEERRLLRREVHDHLGPVLTGVSLGLQGARNLLTAGDPDTAARLLDELAGEVERGVQNVRSLARAFLPPLLEERGLASALEDLASRFDGPDLAVRAEVEQAAAAALSAPVAVGLYSVAAEAVTNAHRHARAAGCVVRLEHVGDDVRLQVVDDGVGIDPDRRPGVGLRAVHERADELGGTARIGPGPAGGTVVEVTVPARRDAPVLEAGSAS
ncbi:sensor histidine kinase [Pseudonocardia kunmingensis]|uniref:histidine kinase n=1 Tax=Pseudonocardia kunmingensis TaxID=630975 RepID=A0A543D958_9PSEU|nr:ATP-binding protein [Pseudonocardia kunmingensis]TQM05863.1 histidine kinase/DNA gyrase B/HSP90-like ATPase [Pseudonocardia kunmingensis]